MERDVFRQDMYERFRFYRTWKKSKRGKPPVLPLQGTAPSVVVPKVGQRALPWVKTQRDDIDLDLITDERSLHRKYRKAYFAVNRLKAYFERNLPELKYNKCLGWGGNGLAAAFDIIDVDGQKERAVVVKMLFLDDPKWLIQEVGNLMVFDDSEHIVQLLYQDEMPLPDKKLEADLAIADADDAESSNEDAESSEEKVEPMPNFFITEMLENGDLSNFLVAVRQHKERVPNAFLWRFCLCLTRMCIALGFPTTVLPNYPDRAGPMTETVPQRYRNKPKRLVHFDFDPRNIFVGDVSPNGEHTMAPILKLGDFGHLTEVKPRQRDRYYERFRTHGKQGYYAPEQFCEDWDYITPDQNLVASHQIAGNYGPHTNIWAMGYVMECLITLSYPAQPPKPTVTNRMPPADKEEYHTYGAHLEQEIYSYVDRDLIYLVLRLQAHLPADRLSLHELEQYVTDMAAAKENCGQTDAELTQWLQKIMYDPPPPEGEPFEMMPVMRKVARAQRARGSARSQRGGRAERGSPARGRASLQRTSSRQGGDGIDHQEDLPNSQTPETWADINSTTALRRRSIRHGMLEEPFTV